MTLIKVKHEDRVKVSKILAINGRFQGLKGDFFNIQENSEEALKKITEAGIKYREVCTI